MRLNSSRVLSSCLFTVLLATSVPQSLFAAQGDIYKVGSWVTYKTDMKTETPPSAGAGGMGAMGGMPTMSPEMLANMPPDKRAQIEAVMKQQTAMQKGMGRSDPGQMQNKMMKDMDFKIKLAVVGKEQRDGKDYIWMEMSMSVKMPDPEKMMAGMLASMPPDQQKKAKASMAKSKEKMAKNPMFSKDGRMKVVMKMLVEKPDPKNPVTLNPIEMWKKQGDGPVVKTTAEDMAKFAKGETEYASKKKTHTVEEMHSETESKRNLFGLSDEKRAQVEETTDKVGQVAKMGKAAAAVIPGGQFAAAGLGVLGEMMAAGSDIANIGIQSKTTMDMKSESTTESEQKGVTKLLSSDSKVVGAEDIDVPGAGSIKVVHTQTSEVKERTDTGKAKSDNKTDMKVNTETHVGVDGGAQSKTGKVIGGVGSAIGFVSDPFGRRKKAAQKQQDDMNKNIADATGHIEVNTETKTQSEVVKDYWVSPEIPAMGLAKMVEATQEKDSDMKMDMKMGNQDMANNPYAQMGGNPMMGGMGGAPKQPKPKRIMETVIDQMGTSGAKSELE